MMAFEEARLRFTLRFEFLNPAVDHKHHATSLDDGDFIFRSGQLLPLACHG